MTILRFVLAALVALAAAPAVAQDWPSGTVRVIVPYAVGGPLDFPARLMIDRLAAQTKGVFILEHRAGAGGTLGAQAVVQSPPDGQTFLFTTSSIAVAPALYPKLPFDPLQALTPVSLITEAPITVVVRPNHPFRDLADLIAKAKAEPKKYTFGSGGVGSGNHLAGELLKRLAGIDMLHVPYRGTSASMTALYAGDVDVVFASTIETLPHARDGRVRVLGVGSPQRLPELPDVPAVAEQVKGYLMANWYGFYGPRGLPQPILSRLQSELAKARTDAHLVERSNSIGMSMILTPPDALRERMEAEVPRWKQIVSEIGLRTE